MPNINTNIFILFSLFFVFSCKYYILYLNILPVVSTLTVKEINAHSFSFFKCKFFSFRFVFKKNFFLFSSPTFLQHQRIHILIFNSHIHVSLTLQQKNTTDHVYRTLKIILPGLMYSPSDR